MTDQGLIGKTVYWVSVGHISRGVVRDSREVIWPNDTLTIEHVDGYKQTIGASRVHCDPLDAAREARECAEALLDAAKRLEGEASDADNESY